MRNQVWYRTLQWGLILLSASTPVLVALAQKADSYPSLRSASLVTSVLLAILATSLRTFKFEENWLNYRTALQLPSGQAWLPWHSEAPLTPQSLLRLAANPLPTPLAHLLQNSKRPFGGRNMLLCYLAQRIDMRLDPGLQLLTASRFRVGVR